MKKWGSPWFWLGFLILLFVAGFRDGGGVDYDSYVWIFKTLDQSYYTSEKIEQGYLAINRLVKAFGGDYEIVIFFSFFVSAYLLFVTLKKYSPYSGLSVCIVWGLHVVFVYCNAVRQSIAISLCVWAVGFVINKQPIRFFASVFLATLFHKSAFVFFPAYFLGNYLFNRFVLVLGYLVSLLSIFYQEYLFSLIAFVASNLFTDRYGNILLKVLTNEREIGIKLIFFNLMMIIIFLQYKTLNANNGVFVNLHYWGLIIMNVTNGFPTLPRLGHYYSFFSVISIPILVQSIRCNTKRRLLYILVFFTFSVLFFRELIGNGHLMLPYKNYMSRYF